MKLKYYLRGVGVGIVFATLIMLIVCSSYKDNLTDAEIIQRAMNLGMIMPDTEEESEDVSKKESQQENDSTSNQVEPEPPVSNKPVTDIPNTQQTDTQTPGTESTQPSSVTIQILPGMIAEDVVNDLYKNGLISDAESFRKYMWSTGISSELENGIYEIPVGATEDQIIEIFRAGNGEN